MKGILVITCWDWLAIVKFKLNCLLWVIILTTREQSVVLEIHSSMDVKNGLTLHLKIENEHSISFLGLEVLSQYGEPDHLCVANKGV